MGDVTSPCVTPLVSLPCQPPDTGKGGHRGGTVLGCLCGVVLGGIPMGEAFEGRDEVLTSEANGGISESRRLSRSKHCTERPKAARVAHSESQHSNASGLSGSFL